ncbi:MAG: cyclic nucleotide-binding domain-containing protein [Alphaproteobacteria bacterium]|nr:cyclic nucleotide-binding domain-containing protein [Alphaproteobacteria bacterium]
MAHTLRIPLIADVTDPIAARLRTLQSLSEMDGTGDFLGQLPGEALARFALEGEVLHLRAGQELGWSAGHWGELFVILDGVMALETDGNERWLCLGDPIGALGGGAGEVAYPIVALTDVRILALPHGTLQRLAADRPTVATALLRALAGVAAARLAA